MRTWRFLSIASIWKDSWRLKKELTKMKKFSMRSSPGGDGLKNCQIADSDIAPTGRCLTGWGLNSRILNMTCTLHCRVHETCFFFNYSFSRSPSVIEIEAPLKKLRTAVLAWYSHNGAKVGNSSLFYISHQERW